MEILPFIPRTLFYFVGSLSCMPTFIEQILVLPRSQQSSLFVVVQILTFSRISFPDLQPVIVAEVPLPVGPSRWNFWHST
jgi:hypothetical protein